MLQPARSYEEACRTFRWRIPEYYNIGVDICDRQAAPGMDGNRTALIVSTEDGQDRRYSFITMKLLSNRLANVLAAQGVGNGDRVAVLLSQSLETALAHIAIYKLGAIAVPLFTLFGEDALAYRLGDSGAKALITDIANLPKLEGISLPALQSVLCADGARDGAPHLWKLMEKASDRFEPFKTKAEDPAIIIYTSGTTGQPKGALHAHRTLLGHLPGVEFPHEFFPQPGDVFWTPADWAWIGGLFDVLFPAWHHGVTVLAHRARKFDPEQAFHLMGQFGVRNVFFPPTALKLLRQVSKPRERYNFRLRSFGSGGETLGAELLDWGRSTFGLTINEFYGQTECNLVIGNCAKLMEVVPGSMGRAIPGHFVDIVDDDGVPLAAGEAGNIAVRAPDPVMFLGYWNNEKATIDKFVNGWLLTGDTGTRDLDGYFRFRGRSDDVITSAGYRIGPSEIEDCLMKHKAVIMAAVIGVPDPVRTENIKAFLVLKPEAKPTNELSTANLTREIQEFVKTRLAAHEYPRLIEFVEELPLTATGKIKRKDLREMEERKGN